MSQAVKMQASKVEDYEELATNVLTYALSDPVSPRTCALCILGCLAGIFNGLGDPDSKELSSRSVSRRSRLCELLLKFLLHPRTTRDMRGLFGKFDSLAKSSCMHNNNALSFIGKSQGRGFLAVGERLWKAHGHCYPSVAHLLIFQIFERLMSVLKDASRPTSLPRVAKGTNTRHWPQSIDSILLHGADSFVNSVNMWQLYLPLPIALSFLSAAIQTCGRQLVIAVFSSKLFVRQLEATIEKVNTATREGQLVSLHMNPHCFSAEFLRQIEKDSPSRDSMRLWMMGEELKMLRILSEGIQLAENSQWKSEFPTNDQRIQRSFAHFGLHFNSAVLPEEKSQLHRMLHGCLRDDPPTVDTIRRDIFRLRASNECGRLGCPKSFQDVGKRYQRCAKCGVVAYCGGACQKDDWDKVDRPHEHICPQLALLLDAGGGPHLLTNSPLFVENVSHKNVQQTSLDAIQEWLEYRETWKEEADRCFWNTLRGTLITDGTKETLSPMHPSSASPS
ncbi:hypothetical protein CPB85DRAFT_269601 [Mucidula mucida]|nr:hypothetical protein CPB85DRAFT_269601 [Mucidula mucida]